MKEIQKLSLSYNNGSNRTEETKREIYNLLSYHSRGPYCSFSVDINNYMEPKSLDQQIEEATFVSSGDISDWYHSNDTEDIKDSPNHQSCDQDIAAFLAGPERIYAVRCGGGYQVFESVKAGNEWSNKY